MSRQKLFKEADLARAIKVSRASGLEIARVEIDPNGRIVIVSGKAEPAKPSALADWKAKRDARKAQGA